MAESNEPLASFIVAACVPLDSGHASGTLDRAEEILAAHPAVGTSDIRAAAILGDDTTVRRFLAVDPANATAKGGPYGWDALTHLCFSKYLRLDRTRSSGFVRAAQALLEQGADPNRITHWGKTALHNAVRRDNAIETIEVLLEHGANPTLKEVGANIDRSTAGKSAVSLAARRGRGDVLGLVERRSASPRPRRGRPGIVRSVPIRLSHLVIGNRRLYPFKV
jgi:ankyrin repeat protein